MVEDVDGKQGKDGRDDQESAGAFELTGHRLREDSTSVRSQRTATRAIAAYRERRTAIAAAVRRAETRMPRLRGQGRPWPRRRARASTRARGTLLPA